MFEARLVNVNIFKKIVEAIKDLVSEVNFDISNDGISLQAMDASHVALIVMHLAAKEFDEFRCDTPQTIGVSVSNLSKVLKIASPDDAITLRAEEDATELTIMFEGKDDQKTSTFALALRTLDADQLGIPEEEYDASVVMHSSEFARICRELTPITDTLNIEADKENIHFNVAGDVGEGTISLRHNDSDIPEERTLMTVTQNVKTAYALRYLVLFNKASTLGEAVKLEMSAEVPMKVTYDFDLGTIKYFLAPKVADE